MKMDFITDKGSNSPVSDFGEFWLANKVISIKFCIKKVVFKISKKNFLFWVIAIQLELAIGMLLLLYPEALWLLGVDYTQV